jgi:hypothetical protein
MFQLPGEKMLSKFFPTRLRLDGFFRQNQQLHQNAFNPKAFHKLSQLPSNSANFKYNGNVDAEMLCLCPFNPVLKTQPFTI